MEARISALERERTLDRLEGETYDCAIIGGGITGAGVAREATERGLRVALLEAHDFASGTSSRSSKLIHGGLRYLAMGDVRLVRETALERKEIRRIAPHLAEPRWMLVPVRSRAGMVKIRAGITAYEKLGAVEEGDLHEAWSSRELETREPLLRRSVYRFVCAYREYLTDDARLVLANLRAAASEGAAVLNHARVESLLVDGGRARGVEAACRLTGRRVRVRAQSVINAAGPWVDAVRRLETGDAPGMLHLSKGIHLVLSAERLPVRNLMVLGASDGRSVFVIRRLGVVILGTTDTSHPGGPELWPEIRSEDVEYLLEPLPRYFDVEPVKLDEVLAAWAGLRPLIAQPGKKPTEISRRDEILVGPAGVVTIAGGKLTGYRPMARRTVEKVAEIGALSVRPPHERSAPLPGGDFDGDLERLAAQLAADAGLGASAAARLVRLYGAEAAAAGTGEPPLADGEEISSAEVDWAVTREGAASVEDVLYRRMRIAVYDPRLRARLVGPVSERMARLLGWDSARREREARGAASRLADDLSFVGEGTG
jgi:glycerol-3-phosphate dehydrogenase